MPPHPDDGSPFFQLARTVLQQAMFSLNIHVVEPERIIGHYDRVQYLLQILVQLSQTYHGEEMLVSWIQTCQQVSLSISEHLESIEEYGYDTGDEEDSVVPQRIIIEFEKTLTGGRPRVRLPWDTVTAYRKSNHSWSEIATLLALSPKTLLRYRQRDQYEDPNPYSTITDDNLDALTRRMISGTGGVVGLTFMQSLISDCGHKVQRRRIRASMARVDVLGNLERWAALIPRSVYSVKAPNSLWHMDGNLKLKDYGFVLHGAIDGYSRRIIYIECNTNNRAATVLDAFLHGVGSVEAVPRRVRADKGLENREVAVWMIMTNGTDRGSFITGRSVHNQRIERLWRDVNRWLTPFHLVFDFLRDNILYDIADEVDRFALILVYLPLLRRSLSQFSRVWNGHKIRTEGHRTPIQLYAQGNPESLWTPTSNAELEEYGIDWEGPVPHEEDEGLVVVEPPRNPLTEHDWEVLKQQVRDQLHPEVETLENNLMSPDFNYGADLYQEIRLWIEHRIAQYEN